MSKLAFCFLDFHVSFFFFLIFFFLSISFVAFPLITFILFFLCCFRLLLHPFPFFFKNLALYLSSSCVALVCLPNPQLLALRPPLHESHFSISISTIIVVTFPLQLLTEPPLIPSSFVFSFFSLSSSLFLYNSFPYLLLFFFLLFSLFIAKMNLILH